MIAFRLAFSNHSQTIPLTILSGMPQHENRQTFSGNLAAIVATSLRVYSIALNALGVLHEHNRHMHKSRMPWRHSLTFSLTIQIITNPIITVRIILRESSNSSFYRQFAFFYSVSERERERERLKSISIIRPIVHFDRSAIASAIRLPE